MVRSSSLSSGLPQGLVKPLVNSRSDSFETRSSMSISSSRSPVYFVYRYFTLVVVLLLPRRRRHRGVFLQCHFACWPPRARIAAVVTALFTAADLLDRVQ